MAKARDAEQLRAAQAVLFPLLGLSLEQTATLLGRDRYWVSRTRNRVLRGEPASITRGGRRHAIATEDDELRLVRSAIEQPGRYPAERMSVRAALRNLLDAQTAQPVAESTITSILNRTAPRLVPGARGKDLIHIADHLAHVWYWQDALARTLESVSSW